MQDQMPLWKVVLYWPGWSLVFGAMFVIQLIRNWHARAVRTAHQEHLKSTLEQLGMVRALFSEAIEKEEVIKTDAQRAFVRAVAYNILGAEGHIRAALGNADLPPRQAVSKADVE